MCPEAGRAKREEGQEDTPAFLSKYLPVLGHSTDASMILQVGNG